MKRLLLRKVPGAPSLGHALLFITYLGLNTGFIFVFIDDSLLPLHIIVAARTGWYESLFVLLAVINYYQVGHCESLLDSVSQS